MKTSAAEVAVDGWSGWDDGALDAPRVATVPTFLDFARIVMVEREAGGVRGVAQERNRFDTHIATASFANDVIDRIAPKHVAAWLRDMQAKKAQDRRGDRFLSRHTIHRSLSLVSAVFLEAGVQGRGYIETNPCTGLRVKGSSGSTKDKWTWLRLHEVEAIERCEAIDEHDRLIILFAIATGLRQGEQSSLRLEDLVVDGPWPHVHVRYGSLNKPPKNGKKREVPLLDPFGIRVAKRWLDLLPAYCTNNPHGLVFPHRNGTQRGVGKPLGSGWMENGSFVDKWKLARRAAGIDRNVRWHDLRHSAASLLATGAWGRRWELAEIRDFLGHSAVSMTERYAHLGVDALKKAAQETAAAAAANARAPQTLNLNVATIPESVRAFFDQIGVRVEERAS